MSATTTPGLSDLGTVEALKRVKAVESEWEAKLAEARAHRDQILQRWRDETEATVHAAQLESERERSEAIQAARIAADGEAAKMLADGDRAAEAAGREDPEDLTEKRAAILAAVLGEFGAD